MQYEAFDALECRGDDTEEPTDNEVSETDSSSDKEPKRTIAYLDRGNNLEEERKKSKAEKRRKKEEKKEKRRKKDERLKKAASGLQE